MATPLVSIPGSSLVAPANDGGDTPMTAGAGDDVDGGHHGRHVDHLAMGAATSNARTVNQVLAESRVLTVIEELESDLIIDFPDYGVDELLQIGQRMVASMNHWFGEGTLDVFEDHLQRRKAQPHFANARSVRHALDRIRLRQASRVFHAQP